MRDHLFQFRDRTGARRTLRLGRLGVNARAVVKAHVRHLVAASVSGEPLPRPTAEWLATIGEQLHQRLVKLDLVAPRKLPGQTEIGPAFDAYIARRDDVKDTTTTKLKQARASLVKFFGETRDMATVTKAEAADWYRNARKGYAAATVAGLLKKARQVWADAVDRGLLAGNPFKSIRGGTMANDSRRRYVTCEDVQRCMDASPDASWRLLFALARFAALRVPSETHGLRWADVDWDKGELLVRSPKTEHLPGRESRRVPICKPLMDALMDAYSHADDGEAYCLGRLRHTGNTSTSAHKIAVKAGLVVWPRFWQNLRSSCETDWAAVLPIHAACAFAGNTQAVALKHYLQVTDEHRDKLKTLGAVEALQDSGGVTRERTERMAAQTAVPAAPHGSETYLLAPMGPFLAPPPLSVLRFCERAQARALQSLKEAAPHIRREQIWQLEQAVKAAKAKGGGK